MVSETGSAQICLEQNAGGETVKTGLANPVIFQPGRSALRAAHPPISLHLDMVRCRQRAHVSSTRLFDTVLIEGLDEQLGNLLCFTTFDLITFQHVDKLTIPEQGH